MLKHPSLPSFSGRLPPPTSPDSALFPLLILNSPCAHSQFARLDLSQCAWCKTPCRKRWHSLCQIQILKALLLWEDGGDILNAAASQKKNKVIQVSCTCTISGTLACMQMCSALSMANQTSVIFSTEPSATRSGLRRNTECARCTRANCSSLQPFLLINEHAADAALIPSSSNDRGRCSKAAHDSLYKR